MAKFTAIRRGSSLLSNFAADDPALKRYYEELALKFAENAANEHDPDNIPWRVSPIQADSGNTNPHRRY